MKAVKGVCCVYLPAIGFIPLFAEIAQKFFLNNYFSFNHVFSRAEGENLTKATSCTTSKSRNFVGNVRRLGPPFFTRAARVIGAKCGASQAKGNPVDKKTNREGQNQQTRKTQS